MGIVNAKIKNITVADWNKAITSGFYNSESGASNTPVSNVNITGTVYATDSMILQEVWIQNDSMEKLNHYFRKGIKNQKVITWTKWFISSLTLVEIQEIDTLTRKLKGHISSSNNFRNLIPDAVTSIIFTTDTMPSNATLIDVDDDGDGGVVAWLDTNDNTIMYVSTQKAGVKVQGNENSYQMFYECNNLSSIFISNFDTSNVLNMNNMFCICTNLTSLDLSNFDTSKVTDMGRMFYGCKILNSLNISNFNSSKVINMNKMFSGCNILQSIDVSNFDTSKVTNMSYMFAYCNKLKTIDASKWNTTNVTDMSYMFSGCSALSTMTGNLSNFDTSNVTNMRRMFGDCNLLVGLDVSNFDTSKVTDMNSMFAYCSNLTSLDVSNFDTSKVTDMGRMFYKCYKLTSIKVGDKFKWICTLSDLGLTDTWQDETGTQYTSTDTFPSNVVHTYTKVIDPNSISETENTETE